MSTTENNKENNMETESKINIKVNKNKINLYDLFFKISKPVFEQHPQFQIKWRVSYKTPTLQIDLNDLRVAVSYLVSFESLLYQYPNLKERFFIFYVGDTRTNEFSIFFTSQKEIKEIDTENYEDED